MYEVAYMSIKVSQITGNYIDFSTAYQQTKQQNSTLLALCEGNPPVTFGFLSQKAIDVKKLMSWRHYEYLFDPWVEENEIILFQKSIF